MVLIGCGDQISDWNSVDLSDGSDEPHHKKQFDKKSSHSSDADEMKDPFIIVIDNAHLMCPTSWMLFESLMAEAEGVAFFLIM